MALLTVQPVDDYMSYEECSDLLRDTGHPVAARTIRGWVERNRIHTEREGRRTVVSFSDVLALHKKAVEAGTI